jgi:hypothetical protein
MANGHNSHDDDVEHDESDGSRRSFMKVVGSTVFTVTLLDIAGHVSTFAQSGGCGGGTPDANCTAAAGPDANCGLGSPTLVDEDQHCGGGMLPVDSDGSCSKNTGPGGDVSDQACVETVDPDNNCNKPSGGMTDSDNACSGTSEDASCNAQASEDESCSGTSNDEACRGNAPDLGWDPDGSCTEAASDADQSCERSDAHFDFPDEHCNQLNNGTIDEDQHCGPPVIEPGVMDEDQSCRPGSSDQSCDPLDPVTDESE